MRIRGLVLGLAAAAAALCALSLGGPAAAQPTAGGRVAAYDSIERPILAGLNRIRRRHGLRPLALSRPLARAADLHADSMAARGYFSHVSPDGTSFDRRIARFYPARRTAPWAVGENLLWATDLTPARAVQMWMESPGHRANILSRGFREIGVSAVRASSATGAFRGLDVTIVVTDFGSR